MIHVQRPKLSTRNLSAGVAVSLVAGGLAAAPADARLSTEYTYRTKACEQPNYSTQGPTRRPKAVSNYVDTSWKCSPLSPGSGYGRAWTWWASREFYSPNEVTGVTGGIVSYKVTGVSSRSVIEGGKMRSTMYNAGPHEMTAKSWRTL